MRASAGLLLVVALLTALLTFPLIVKAGDGGPVNTGDGQWSIWSVAWVARALVADPLHVYDANIFSPHKGTLAYSEANLVAGALAIPAWWATLNPYLAHNTAILLAFLLTSLATFALARRLLSLRRPASGTREPGGSSSRLASADVDTFAAALVAALAFTFAPVVIVRYAHVQLLMTTGLPVTMIAFHRFVERRSMGRIVALSAALVFAALCSGYYGIFAGLAVGLGFVYYAVTRRLWRSARYVAACAAVVLLAGLLVLPFFLPYLQLERGGDAFRSLDESRRYAADWRSYLTSTARVQQWLLGRVVPFDRSAFPERVLFPGFIVSALALWGLVTARRPGTGTKEEVAAAAGSQVAAGTSSELAAGRRADVAAGAGDQVAAGARADAAAGAGDKFTASADVAAGLCARRQESIGFYGLVAFVAAWLSFGPSAGLYWLAYRFVPGFTLTRAPARFGFLVVFALAVLAAFGLQAIGERLRNRRWGLTLLVPALLVVETAAIPLDIRNALPMPAPHVALASLPAGAVAEFPYFYLPRDIYRNSIYMLYSTAHWHPLVNGYSDYIPEDYRDTVVAISTFPSREAFRLIRARGARYALFHLDMYDRRSREKLLDAIRRYSDFLRPLSQSGDVWLYEIISWPQ